MTVLCDWQIEDRVSALSMIEPYDSSLLQPASYDVLLAEDLRRELEGNYVFDMARPAMATTWKVQAWSDGYVLPQGVFLLASTVEYFKIPTDIVARVEGKSSLARAGLQIHSAGFIDPGFEGNITLELVNFSRRAILLRPGLPIAQVSFHRMDQTPTAPYSAERNHYQGSRGTIGSRWQREP